MVRFMFQSLFPGERAYITHWIGGWLRYKMVLIFKTLLALLCNLGVFFNVECIWWTSRHFSSVPILTVPIIRSKILCDIHKDRFWRLHGFRCLGSLVQVCNLDMDAWMFLCVDRCAGDVILVVLPLLLATQTCFDTRETCCSEGIVISVVLILQR
jgi:hypothetical protein